MRIVDLELSMKGDLTKNYKRLESKLFELTGQLEKVTREKDDLAQGARRNDRLIRDLQQQVAEKDKTRQRQDDDLNKTNEKLRKMKQDIVDLEGRESDLMLSKRRAERESDDFKEKSVRLEKEVEKMKLRLASGATAV